jgi:hypothetical protein
LKKSAFRLEDLRDMVLNANLLMKAVDFDCRPRCCEPKGKLFKFAPRLLTPCLRREADGLSCADEVPRMCGSGINEPTVVLADCQDVKVATAKKSQQCRNTKLPVHRGEHLFIIKDCCYDFIKGSLNFVMPSGINRHFLWLVSRQGTVTNAELKASHPPVLVLPESRIENVQGVLLAEDLLCVAPNRFSPFPSDQFQHLIVDLDL